MSNTAWRAFIKQDHRTYSEYFDTEEEATTAVDEQTMGWDRATWDEAIDVYVAKEQQP